MGTQKNTQNLCSKIWVRKYLQIYAEKFCLSKPMREQCFTLILPIFFVLKILSVKRLIHYHRRVTRHIGPVSLGAFRPECQADMPGNASAALFKSFYYLFTCRCSGGSDVKGVIYEAEGACEGWYGFTRGSIWGHLRGLLWVWNHKQYQPG